MSALFVFVVSALRADLLFRGANGEEKGVNAGGEKRTVVDACPYKSSEDMAKPVGEELAPAEKWDGFSRPILFKI